MKNLIFWVFLLPISIFAQTSIHYTIQVGTFVNPKIEDFHLIQPYGYLYAEDFDNNFSKVYLGEFKT